MNTYRMNAVMAGILYFLGTAFGIGSTIIGGEVISSIVKTKPLSGENILHLVAQNPSGLLGGAFLILLMGISLAAMTVFLYPLFRKDSEELAMGMVLFRGALEGTWYFITTLSILILFALGTEYSATGSDSDVLQSLGNVVYQFQDLLGPVGTTMFLLGASCLYISFYRTRLLPRWLSIWGLIGVIPYLGYVVLHFFQMDTGIGFYLQMILALQEMVMAFWLILKGFDQAALNRLLSHNPGV
ncbi:MAG: DUF4386 domain-containing protein [Fibrobacterota bacterium]